MIWKHGHYAVWSRKNYDGYLDSDVLYARHALAIDEPRKDFPRVIWGTQDEEDKTKGREPEWLKQIWFAGCHSDIGGSYPEPQSRLSDIALQWMINELEECIPDIQVRHDILVTSPDPKGLQHAELYIWELGPIKLKWAQGSRDVNDFRLDNSVIDRLKAVAVPQMGEVKPYRPLSLAKHPQAKAFYVKLP